MSWAIGYDSTWNRDIGYGVPAYCDFPGCMKEIDRGISYVCGGEPYGGEFGCGLYFCPDHLDMSGDRRDNKQLCMRCYVNHGKKYDPTPDHPEWIEWKLTDDSWARWRREHPEEVAAMTLKFPKSPKLPKLRSKNECVDLAKKIVRARGACECCNQLPTDLFPLDGAHIVPVRHSWTAADLRNLICLRRDCHRHFTDNPHEFQEWMEARFPGRLAELKSLARVHGKPDWDVIWDGLKEEERKGE
jgi:hypothetical protein